MNNYQSLSTMYTTFHNSHAHIRMHNKYATLDNLSCLPFHIIIKSTKLYNIYCTNAMVDVDCRLYLAYILSWFRVRVCTDSECNWLYSVYLNDDV